MIDPVSVSVAATAVAATSAIYNTVRNEALARELRRQRTEMYAVGGSSVIAVTAVAIDHFMFKKKLSSKQFLIERRLDHVEARLDKIDIESIKEGISVQSKKLDKLTDVIENKEKEDE